MDKSEGKVSGDGHHVLVHDWNPIDESGTHKSSDRIEYDIEETRGTMDAIVDALTDKLNPKTYYERAYDLLQRPENREKVRDVLTDAGHRITDSFKRNPLPAILLATGATWMIWESQNSEIEKHAVNTTDKKSSHVFENVKERAQDIIGTVKEKGTEQFEKAKGKGEEQYEQLKEKGARYRSEAQHRQGTFRENASEQQAHARERFREGISRADEEASNRPVLLGATAVFAGLIAGLLLPSTRAVINKVGDISSKTKENTEEAGNAPVEKAAAADRAFKAKGKEPIGEPDKEPESVRKTANLPQVNTEQPASQPVNPKTYSEIKLSERKESGESGKTSSKNV